MAKRGDQARENVKNTIIEAFSSTGGFVAFQDKKIYVQAKDGDSGELIQFAITMTMPKTPVMVGENPTDFTDSDSQSPVAQKVEAPTELGPADRAKIDELKKKLGIIE